jgi:hypothetical protein
MSVHGAEDYEKTVDQILESLVLLAKPKASDVVSRINTEIATGRYPPGSPWLAEGHVTCSIRCLNGDCKRMVDVGSTLLLQDRPWSRIGPNLLCTECGAPGAVNIVPNWHDMKGHTVLFTAGWKNRFG